MPIYWCKFFDVAGRVSGAEKLASSDDAAVIERAKSLYANRVADAYEIWDGARLVQRVTRELPV